MTVEQAKSQATSWLEKLALPYTADRITAETRGRRSVRVETRNCWYSIHFTWPTSRVPTGYLSGYAHRAEEQGHDITGGPFGEKTWNRVLADIRAFETATSARLHPDKSTPMRKERRRGRSCRSSRDGQMARLNPISLPELEGIQPATS